MFIVCTFLPKQIPWLCKLSWPINPFLILILILHRVLGGGVHNKILQRRWMQTQPLQGTPPPRRTQAISANLRAIGQSFEDIPGYSQAILAWRRVCESFICHMTCIGSGKETETIQCPLDCVFGSFVVVFYMKIKNNYQRPTQMENHFCLLHCNLSCLV